MKLPNWPGWALLIGLTALVAGGMAAAGLPSPALFGGLLAATVLALTGRAPERVPGPVVTVAMAVIGVVIGVIGQPSTLAALAGTCCRCCWWGWARWSSAWPRAC